ncbi:MAG: acyltransferase [Bacteroidales bacterium]
MYIKAFNKNDTFLIKGIAIIAILLHNFFHWIPPLIGENEFDFLINRLHRLIESLQATPLEFINVFFSYFGHYGVQLFIFISAYGLTISFSRNPCSWGRFMLDRLTKLYPLLLTAVIVFFFAIILLDQRLLSLYEWREIGYKLLFIHTLIPESGLSLNGPWWFFGLIFQLYLLFPLLFKLIKKYSWKAFILVLILSYGLIYISLFVYQPNNSVTFMQNAPGHLPEFALGVFFALNKDKKINPLFIIAALVLFVSGNFFEVCFPFTFLSLTFLLICLFYFLYPYLQRSKLCYHSFIYFGEISMLLFAVHAFFRPPFIYLNNQWNSFYGALFAALLFSLVVIGVSLIAKPIYIYLVALFQCIILRMCHLIKRISFFRTICKYSDYIIKCALILVFVWLGLRMFLHNPLKEMVNVTYDMDHTINNVYKPYVVNDEKEGVVLFNDQDFSVLAPYITLDKRYRKLILQLSFDLKSLDTNQALPVAVLSIEKGQQHYYWDERLLIDEYGKSLNTGKWEHFFAEFNVNPDVLHVKKVKDLKLFLIKNRGKFCYDNIHVKLMVIK